MDSATEEPRRLRARPSWRDANSRGPLVRSARLGSSRALALSDPSVARLASLLKKRRKSLSMSCAMDQHLAATMHEEDVARPSLDTGSSPFRRAMLVSLGQAAQG